MQLFRGSVDAHKCKSQGRREGIENARSGLGYFSDSSVIVKELGVPFVILGPGERVFDDRMDEYVYMSKVCAAQKIYEKYMSE